MKKKHNKECYTVQLTCYTLSTSCFTQHEPLVYYISSHLMMIIVMIFICVNERKTIGITKLKPLIVKSFTLNKPAVLLLLWAALSLSRNHNWRLKSFFLSVMVCLSTRVSEEPDSPKPEPGVSCVSLRSDRSKGYVIHFKRSKSSASDK